MAAKKVKQPKDPFGGLGDMKIKPSVAQEQEIADLKAQLAVERYGGINPQAAETRATNTLREIEDAARASLARLDVLDVLTVRGDLEWIAGLARDGAA